MPKKYYAVKVGKTPGIYETWAECQKQIHGFSGAVFKGFASREQALEFINRESLCQESDSDAKALGNLVQTEAVAYVDGSYDSTTNTFSYGMVFFHQGCELHFSEKYSDKALAEMRNVAGELKGAQAAMQYCLEHGIKSVTIYHDYEGIARWCHGDWQAKKPGTIAYAEFYRKAKDKVQVEFVKVKGHSGDQYNDLADHLAKKALQLI